MRALPCVASPVIVSQDLASLPKRGSRRKRGERQRYVRFREEAAPPKTAALERKVDFKNEHPTAFPYIPDRYVVSQSFPRWSSQCITRVMVMSCSGPMKPMIASNRSCYSFGSQVRY